MSVPRLALTGPWRNRMSYALLWAVSFLGTWGWLAFGQHGGPAAEKGAIALLSRPAAVSGAAPHDAQATGPVGHASDDPQPDADGGASPPSAADVERAQILKDSIVASERAVSASDPGERNLAISELGDVATPEILQAIDTAITNDPDVVNRLNAIEALVRVAARMPDKSEAIDLLRRVAQSGDADVVPSADQALELMTAPPPDLDAEPVG